MKRPAGKLLGATAPLASSFGEIFERVVGKGIRVESAGSEENADGDAWVTLSAAGVVLLKIEGGVSWRPLLDRPPTPSPPRRRSRSPRGSSS
jgi:hypothetical protein